METSYPMMYEDYDIEGYTLPTSDFDPEVDDGLRAFLLEDFDPAEVERILEGSSTAEKNDSRGSERPARAVFHKNSSVGINVDLETTFCPGFLLIIIAIFVGTGILSSLFVFVSTAFRGQKKHTNNHFLHIFAANFFILFPLLFAIPTRVAKQWNFGRTWYQMMAITFNAALTVCALQLAYLVTIHCSEVVSLKKTSVTWRRCVSFVIWLLGFATAWPCGVYDSIQSDLIKGDSLRRGRTVGANVYIVINACLGFLLPTIIVIGYLSVAFVKTQRRAEQLGEDPRKYIHSLKRSAGFYFLYVLCWLPYRSWRLETVRTQTFSDCMVALDVTLLIGIIFCTIMPITFYAIDARTRQRKVDEEKVGRTPTQLRSYPVI